jgi:hypothetical protein
VDSKGSLRIQNKPPLGPDRSQRHRAHISWERRRFEPYEQRTLLKNFNSCENWGCEKERSEISREL